MSWFDDLTAQAESALQAAVKGVDKVLDIKEEPGTILQGAKNGKTTEERFLESKKNVAATVATSKLEASSRVFKDDRTSVSRKSATPSSEDSIFDMLKTPTKESKTATKEIENKPETQTEAKTETKTKTKTKIEGTSENDIETNDVPTDSKSQKRSSGNRKRRSGGRKNGAERKKSGGDDAAKNNKQDSSAAKDAVDAKQKKEDQNDTGKAEVVNPTKDDENDVLSQNENDTTTEAKKPAADDSTSAHTNNDSLSNHQDDKPETSLSNGDAAPSSLQTVKNSSEMQEEVIGAVADKIQHTEEKEPRLDSNDAEASSRNTEANQQADQIVEGEGGDFSTAYAEKLAQVSMTLAAREEKILLLTTELDDKRQTHQILLSQIEQLESQLKENHTEQLEKLTAEFTARLGEVEAAKSKAGRERDQLKKQLAEVTDKFSQRVSETDKVSGELIAEKEEKIEALIREGQKLEEKNSKSRTINTKLQKKIKEAEKTTIQLNEQVDEFKARVSSLELDLKEKTEAVKKYEQSANQVGKMSDQQSKELKELKEKLKAAGTKNDGLQAALDKSYKLNASLEKKLAEESKTAQAAVVQADASAQDKLQQEIEKARTEFSQREDEFTAQIADLRAAVSRNENQAARREANLQLEVQDLNERLRDAERREQQLTESVSQTARPLVRQIDMLRESLADQTASHEIAEKTLSTRLEEALGAKAQAEEREREAQDNLSTFRIKLVGLEDKNATLRKTLFAQQSDADTLRSKIDDLEVQIQLENTKNSTLASSHANAKQTWQMEKIKLEQMATDRVKAKEQEMLIEVEKLEKELRKASSKITIQPSVPTTPSLAERPSPTPLESSPSNGGAPAGDDDAVAREKYSHRLVHKDRELLALQSQLEELEKSRSSIAEELVDMVAKNEDLSKQVEDLPQLKLNLAQTEQKLDQVMQMYGEKAEQAQEYQLDIQDMREMFQAQIQQLIAQIEVLKQN